MIWHALTTYEYAERAVRNRLHEIGYAAATPVEFVQRIGAGKRPHMVPVPLLPEYCLIGSDQGFDWPAIKRTRGVKGIMQMDGAPARIPTLAVESIIAMPDELEAKRFRPTGPAFAIGARVRVMTGAFAGHASELRSIKQAQARVVLQILGSSREVVISVADLQAA